jgi:hypothetical protein
MMTDRVGLNWLLCSRVAGTAAIASWVGLGAVLGNVGLQRLVSGDPQRLMENPVAMLADFAVAAAATGLLARKTSLGGTLVILALLMLADVAGALVAIIVIGELELVHVGRVTVALSGYGAQLLGGTVGLTVARRPR